MSTAEGSLTVAVTGPTGTFGFGLVPLLQAEPRIERIVGIARRPFDPARHGWSKMEYRQGDVRDPDALREGFAGCDVVVHLAFMITGNASPETIRAINVEGTLNVFRAARDAGARRLQHRRRRRPEWRGRGARARAGAGADSGARRTRRRAGGVLAAAPAVPAARDRVGRGGQPSLDHGHRQGRARARLPPALQRP